MLFTAAFILWYTAEILFATTLKSFFGIDRQLLNDLTGKIVLALLLVQIVLLQKYSRREGWIVAAASVPIVVGTVLSENHYLLSAWLFVIAAKNADFERLVRIAYRILWLTIPLVLLLCALGIAENREVYREGALRYSFGFNHPNQLGLRVFQLCVCHFYIRYRRLGAGDFLFGLAAVLFLFKYPNSQTAYFSTALLTGLFLWLQRLEKEEGKRAEIRFTHFSERLIWLYVFCNVISLLFSIADIRRYPLLLRLDELLSRRFSLCHIDFRLYGVSVWGQKIYVSEEERAAAGIMRRLLLDNAYMSLLLRYGVVVFAMFSLFYLYAMYYFHKRGRCDLVCVLSLYGVYGVMEGGLYKLTHNIFLLALSYALYRKQPENTSAYLSDAHRHILSRKQTGDSTEAEYSVEGKEVIAAR